MLYYKKDFHNNIDAPSVFSIHKRKKEKNDMANAKKYDDLTFTDDFMFCKVMTTNPELCHELLEIILGKKVFQSRDVCRQRVHLLSDQF